MTQAHRRPNDSPPEPIEAFMARRLREVTGFRGGYRDIAPVLVRTLATGPAGLVAAAMLDARRRAGAAQDRTRTREVPQSRPAAVTPARPVIRVAAAPVVAPSRSTPVSKGLGRIVAALDRSPQAKAIAGDAAMLAATVPGAARGLWHLAADVVATGASGVQMLDPEKRRTALRSLVKAADAGASFASEAIAEPAETASRVRDILQDFTRGLAVKTLPSETPVEDTFMDEIDRKVGIGLNQGELLFDVASLFAGGAALKGLAGAGKAAGGLKTIEHYVARGVPPSTAAYFVQPYAGMGHHYLPRRTRLPELLGGGPIPQAISDSPFFLLKPEGIQMGDMYELHYRVDPHFNGGRVPQRFGNVRGWSGKALGWEKEDALGRIWYGAPDPLKMTAGGTLGTGVVGLGAWVDDHDGEEKRR